MSNLNPIQASLEKAWYSKPGCWRVLWPLSRLFQSIALRRMQRVQHDLCHGLPVIVIGNISVGGTGKTPVVQALVQYLQQAGWRVGLVSRGYGGRAPRYPLWVDDDTPVAHSGDEAALLVQTTGVPMAVAPIRSDAVAMLARKQCCDVVISDDGLQHYDMPRIWEVAVIDGERGLGNGYCLPMGPLREPPERLESVDCIWINGEKSIDTIDTLPGDTLPGQSFRLSPQPLRRIDRVDDPNVAQNAPQGQLKKTAVHAVAGIGHPQRFFHTLQSQGFDVHSHVFPDHHRYCVDDMPADDGLPVVMTEKDAVKCTALDLPPRQAGYWVLPVRAELQSPAILADCKAMERALARFR